MSAPQKFDDGTPITNVLDQVRVWEKQLTPEQIRRACDFVETQGWTLGTWPPAYVWAFAYQSVDP